MKDIVTAVLKDGKQFSIKGRMRWGTSAYCYVKSIALTDYCQYVMLEINEHSGRTLYLPADQIALLISREEEN